MKALAFALCLLALPAAAQMACGDHHEIAERLESAYSETLRSSGLSDPHGELFELFASAGGTWTLIVTVPGGASCILATGQNYLRVPVTVPKGRGL